METKLFEVCGKIRKDLIFKPGFQLCRSWCGFLLHRRRVDNAALQKNPRQKTRHELGQCMVVEHAVAAGELANICLEILYFRMNIFKHVSWKFTDNENCDPTRCST